MASLERLPWCRAALDALACDRVVCYGLGSVFGSQNAQWQLAFALLLSDDLEVYDPVLQVEELEYLNEAFGCAEAPPPETKQQPGTLFFMPHCPQDLYVAVLQANDDAVIVGNSFKSYSQRIDVDPRLVPYFDLCDEVPLLVDADDRAFNDTAIMRFRCN